MPRPLLPETRIAPQLLDGMAHFHEDTLQEVIRAVDTHDVVVVGMRQNPFPKKAYKLLKERGIAFHSLEYGSYLSDWRRRLAIKIWSGFPTFPQVFAKGVLVGGASDLEQALADGSFQKLLDAERRMA